MADPADEVKESGKWPFDAYDAFGYLAPGATFLALVGALEALLRSTHLDAKAIQSIAASAKAIADVHFAVPLVVFGTAIVLAYVVGHVVASVSSLVLDRGLVVRGHGYPYETLLGMGPRRTRHHVLVAAGHKAAFFWMNLYLLARWWRQAFGGSPTWWVSWVQASLIEVSEWVFLTLFSLGALSIATRCGLYRLLGRRVLRSIYVLLGVVAKVLAFPYELVAWPLSRYIDTRSSFTSSLRRQYRTRFRECFQMEPSTAKTNNYWFSQLFVIEKSKAATGRLMKWLYLYSFSRNLAAAFLLVLAWASIRVWMGGLPRSPAPPAAAWLPVWAWVAGMLMLVRYYYLFAGYYSKFLFRAFVFHAGRVVGK